MLGRHALATEIDFSQREGLSGVVCSTGVGKRRVQVPLGRGHQPHEHPVFSRHLLRRQELGGHAQGIAHSQARHPYAFSKEIATLASSLRSSLEQNHGFHADHLRHALNSRWCLGKREATGDERCDIDLTSA